MHDAIIIGAGHNGLVCAAYLAKAGLDVVVFERSHRIGGACITEELVPGYRFSTFAYNANGPGPKICRDLELADDAFSVVPSDPTMFLPFPDGDHIMLWRDAQRNADALSRFGPRESDGFLAYSRFMDQAVGISKDIFLTSPPTHAELYDRYRDTPLIDVLDALLTRSHWDVLCDFFDSDKVRCAMARADDVGYPTAVGSLLAEVVEAANDGAGVEGISGIPRGGMGAITTVLADAARRFGAEVRTDCPVQGIEVASGRAVGVRLETGELIRARRTVSNADPKRTFLSLIERRHLDESFVRNVERIRTRAGNMKFHAVLSDHPRFAAMPRELQDDPRNVAGVRISPSLDYFEQAWRDCLSGIPSRQPVMSLQLPTAWVPELAPPGKHIFSAWIRYGPGRLREGTWDARRPDVIESVLEILEGYAPGFRDLVEWQRLFTPADIERETGITDATIRHVDMTLDQMLHRRPIPAWAAYRTPLDGLWLCGAGTHPCGSVTGAPGHNAAGEILKEKMTSA